MFLLFSLLAVLLFVSSFEMKAKANFLIKPQEPTKTNCQKFEQV